MIRRNLIALVVVGMLAWLALGVGRRNCTCAQRENPFPSATLLSQRLNLNESQSREVERSHREWESRMQACCARHCDARRQLALALTADTPEPARIEALTEDLCQAYARSERLALAHISRVRQILDTDQRARFDGMLVDALTCRECPACKAHSKPLERH